jgi:hypothetical protein
MWCFGAILKWILRLCLRAQWESEYFTYLRRTSLYRFRACYSRPLSARSQNKDQAQSLSAATQSSQQLRGAHLSWSCRKPTPAPFFVRSSGFKHRRTAASHEHRYHRPELLEIMATGGEEEGYCGRYGE